MDRLTSMAVFVAAIEAGSLIGAARRFGLSASMAGKHVSAIEAELNVRLMQRSTRRLSLTDVGRAYYLRCKRILEEFEDANREASDTQQTVRGVLRVAAPVTFGAMHLGDVVARYLHRHPDVSVEVRLDDRYVDLLTEGIDVAIRIGRLQDSDLVARRLAPCRMVLCASADFLARHGIPKSVEDVLRAPRLVFNEAVSAGDWTLTDLDGQSHVIDGPIRIATNNMQMLIAAALAGAGVTYGPSFVVGQYIAIGDLVALLPDHHTSDLAIHAVYPTARHVSLKLRRFIDQLIASFGRTPPWDLKPKRAISAADKKLRGKSGNRLFDQSQESGVAGPRNHSSARRATTALSSDLMKFWVPSGMRNELPDAVGRSAPNLRRAVRPKLLNLPFTVSRSGWTSVRR